MTCFTCGLVAGEETSPGGLVLVDDHILVNHTAEAGRAGWFIVSPTRHVSRWFQLTDDELVAIARTAADVDRALTDVWGATRVLVASLGWMTADHVHVHVVPTFGDEISYGARVFADRYVPVADTPESAAAIMRRELCGREGRLPTDRSR